MFIVLSRPHAANVALFWTVFATLEGWDWLTGYIQRCVRGAGERGDISAKCARDSW